jgi:hypothetical protein
VSAPPPKQGRVSEEDLLRRKRGRMNIAGEFLRIMGDGCALYLGDIAEFVWKY